MMMLKNLFRSLNKDSKSNSSNAETHSPQHRSTGTVAVATTMHAEGFIKYGQRFIESFLRFWPENYELWIHGEGFDYPEQDRIHFINIDQHLTALNSFKRKHALNPRAKGQMDGKYSYRFDAVRFSNKSYVMADMAKRSGLHHLIWLDADTITFQYVPRDFSSQLLSNGDFMAYLGRTGMHSETGFIAFDLHHPAVHRFFSAVEQMYSKDVVFSLAEWHDCQVIDAIRSVLEAEGLLTSRNLNAFHTSHPFVNSIPGLFMDHMKGPSRKDEKQSHSADYVIPPYTRVQFETGRYGQIRGVVHAAQPASIIEIGTWSGWRAVQMGLAALAVGSQVHYKGYDVFESADQEFDRREMNVKPHFSQAEVTRLLSLLSDFNPDFDFELISGNTNSTLQDETVDLAFIDGGHSVETIQNDFDRLKNSKIILLDDYYSGPIDTNRYGCNRILENRAAWLLPIKDPVKGGGHTQFAITVGEGHAVPQWIQNLQKIA